MKKNFLLLQTYSGHFENAFKRLNFNKIGSKATSGPVNTLTEYQFSDDIQSLSSAHIVYYRIKAMDREGRSAYSNIAPVRLNKIANVQVWPNPFGGSINVTYNASSSTKIDVGIVNSLGKIVKRNNYNMIPGLNQVSLDCLETMSSGIYFIRITNRKTNEVYIHKITK